MMIKRRKTPLRMMQKQQKRMMLQKRNLKMMQSQQKTMTQHKTLLRMMLKQTLQRMKRMHQRTMQRLRKMMQSPRRTTPRKRKTMRQIQTMQRQQKMTLQLLMMLYLLMMLHLLMMPGTRQQRTINLLMINQPMLKLMMPGMRQQRTTNLPMINQRTNKDGAIYNDCVYYTTYSFLCSCLSMRVVLFSVNVDTFVVFRVLCTFFLVSPISETKTQSALFVVFIFF
mmetsp:Transcript_16617/g.25674  ORF Transcript_16617/g.25674 Transcript_16617/m.25674 type:complete len:225 (+) Transcript_16617:658-1332(+)